MMQKEIQKLVWYVFNSDEINVAYELKLYGSSFTGLTIKGDGDLDYTISLPEIEMEDNEVLSYISRGIKGEN